MKKYIIPALVLFLCAYIALKLVSQTHPESTAFEADYSEEKQKGAHIFGFRDTLDLGSLEDKGFNWVTFVPYGSQRDSKSAEIRQRRGDSSEMKRRNEYWIQSIVDARKAGFKVFLKPHIWMFSPEPGKWRSDIYPENDENWTLWSKSYRDFILRYAEIAEKAEAEMYCVGTELTMLSKKKPKFWREVISDVKKIYSGKITYAANWYEEYENITFWDDLDYIGIQAYFPLVNQDYPSVEQISKGWEKYLDDIVKVSKKYNKQVLFTELGYKSSPDGATKPWEWVDYSTEDELIVSEETQANSYQAFFDMVWEKEWFIGMHLWQWRTDNRGRRGKVEVDFTPRGKLAEEVIARRFKE